MPLDCLAGVWLRNQEVLGLDTSKKRDLRERGWLLIDSWKLVSIIAVAFCRYRKNNNHKFRPIRVRIQGKSLPPGGYSQYFFLTETKPERPTLKNG